MRIGLTIQQFDPRLGGAEQWTWQFARQLTSRGHEVHVIAKTFHPQTRDIGVVAEAIEAGGGRLDFAAVAADRCRQLPLDVVHDMGAGWHADVFQPHGGSRRAAFEQNLLLSQPWMRPIKRAAAAVLPRYREFERLNRRQYSSDGKVFLALSKFVAGDFQRFHNVPPEQIRIVYNGVDVERFSPQLRERHRESMRRRIGLGEEQVLLLIVAHNFALKGVPTALSAVGRLLKQGAPVHLAIAGGKRSDQARRWAASAGASDAVTFLGSVDDAAPYYAAADVYVQPTFYDPCSLVVLEALACGLPSVTSRFNGVAELMTHGREGAVLQDPSDPSELVAQLTPLLEPAKRRWCGRLARQLALQNTLDHNCRQMLAVYEECIQRRSEKKDLRAA